MEAVKDRGFGAFVGLTVGDCVGAPFEFKGAFPARRLEIDSPSVFGHLRGCGTDDTETTWAIADAYLSGSDGDLVSRAGKELLAWLATGPKDVGGTTSRGLREFGRHGDAARSGDRVSEANGSLMRCVATGLVRRGDDSRLDAEASALSAITHGSEVCMDACAVYVQIVSSLIDGVSPEEAVAMVRPVTRRIEDAITVARVVDHLGQVNCDGIGHVVYAFTLAIWALLHARSFEDGLTAVVCAGGDTDTNGAIAGAVLGARFGFAAIPQRWISALIDLDAITTRAARLLGLREKI
jgi:ADP-ribosylglycohydrolase